MEILRQRGTLKACGDRDYNALRQASKSDPE